MIKPALPLPTWLAFVSCGLVLVTPSISRAAGDSTSQSDNLPNPQAIAEIQSGKRSTANAAWWGFNEEDSADALQAAIRSGAKRVSVPNLRKDWIVRPLQLASDQELVFETGVVITAMRGAYNGGGDSVLNADGLTNLTIRGYGRAETGLFDVTGDLTVRSSHAVKSDLEEKQEGVTLRVNEANLSPFRHVKVFAVPGRFGGWPANHGLWSWGNEILVGFSRGYYKDLGERHNIDRERPEEHLLARSLDGGETWTIVNPSLHGALIPAGKMLHGIAPPGLQEKPWRDCPGGIDFTHPDFAMTLRMTAVDTGPSRFYYSTDRGHRWEGPFRLPLFGQRGVAARTDYLVNGPRDCLLVLTASKPDGEEGRPFCARTTDGGQSWKFVSWINEHPKGYAIMPSTIRLSERELFTAIRCRDRAKAWIETYRSLDEGKHWKLENVPAPDLGTGNPPSMIRLKDGRVCLTYGHRAPPFGIRARLSQDGGRTWEPEIILRDDGGGTDIGYPRTVQRPDGKIVTIYYFHDQPKGDRYIASTIWDA